jgi:homospermidine synthase
MGRPLTPPYRPHRVLIIGYGAIGTAVLPLLLDRLPVPAGQITVLDRDDRREALRPFLERGLRFEQLTLTKENYAALLRERLTSGDLLIDLTSYIDSVALVEWCRTHGVLFLNSAVERWAGEEGLAHRPEDGLLYPRLWRFREWMTRHGRPDGPTAVIDHGANPGLVSHFVKQALEEIAGVVLDRLSTAKKGSTTALREALDAREWARVSEALGVRAVHISELDTQEASGARPKGEFQSTWSATTMHEEALTLSELCWGTHEGPIPAGARIFDEGPRHMVCLDGPGVETWVASWTPGGQFFFNDTATTEIYTIGEHLTVMDGDRVRYRPTVYFAYQPCEATLESLRESLQAEGYLQENHRVLTDDLARGRDQLGCLLMGHPLKSWWIGSLLSLEEARRMTGPGVNATTLQVAASLAAGLEWLLANPAAGPLLPDDLPHDAILRAARPYLGTFRSEAVEWSPTHGAGGQATWRFPSFRTDASLSTASGLAPARRG